MPLSIHLVELETRPSWVQKTIFGVAKSHALGCRDSQAFLV